jgi:tRNA dimethylallyltransferase
MNANGDKKLTIVCGPTATGKSDFAVTLAKQLDGEIISADSRQVYIGLDIGSGKITREEMQGIPHHLLDVALPTEQFSAELFREKGREAMRDIWARGKHVIICGGSGFYIETLLAKEPLPSVGANPLLRARLTTLSTSELFALLEKKDSRRAETIDPHNRVRLIRALEIVDTLGAVPENSLESEFEAEWIGLDMEPETHRKKIHERLIRRIDQGMIAEVERLLSSGVTHERLFELGLEYRFVSRFLQGELSREALIEELGAAIWQYAKRQRTWFKRNKSIQWLRQG